VTLSHGEIFGRYLYAGAISRNPDALAELFTDDGVFEAPLVPVAHPLLPRRLAGREAIRTGIGAYHEFAADAGTANAEKSRFVLHDTADPDTFIAEIDSVLDQRDGTSTTMSLVWIFRVRGEHIALLRDYFCPMPA
jgi:ketosteroid isomerase-like protein